MLTVEQEEKIHYKPHKAKADDDEVLIQSHCPHQCSRTDHEIIRCSTAVYYWCSRDMTSHLIRRDKEIKKKR